MLLAGNTGRKMSQKKSPSAYHRRIAELCPAVYSHVGYRQSEKNNMSSTCPHNMVNFGLLASEIVSLVWGTPANFNRFRVLAALLHGTPVVGVSQTLRR